jgi:hypothetical protein
MALKSLKTHILAVLSHLDTPQALKQATLKLKFAFIPGKQASHDSYHSVR